MKHFISLTSCLLFSAIALISQPIAAQEDNSSDIKSFTSDGCSAFPDGTLDEGEIWLSCCTAHDFAYWHGGTYDQRKEADNQLRQCVANVGKPLVAKLMLAGVRVGGTPYLPTQFRWGYGWPYLRGYKAVTEDEKKSIAARLGLAKNDSTPITTDSSSSN